MKEDFKKEHFARRDDSHQEKRQNPFREDRAGAKREFNRDNNRSFGESPRRSSYNPNFNRDNKLRQSGDSAYGSRTRRSYDDQADSGRRGEHRRVENDFDNTSKFERRRTAPTGGEGRPFERRTPRENFGDNRRFDRDKAPFRKSSSEDRGAFARKPFDREQRGDSERRPFRKAEFTERRPSYNRSGDERDDRRESSERRPFDREQRGGSDRRPFRRDDNAEERRPSWGDRKPFDRDQRGDSERRPFRRDDNAEGAERRPSWGDRKPFGRKPFDGDAENRFDRKPFRRDEDSRPSWGDRERKPYDREQRGGFDRKPFDRDDRRPRATEETEPEAEQPNFTNVLKELKKGDIRLNRYIAMSGVCSRREADSLIEAGRVTVNDVVVTELGTKVTMNDVIKFDGEQINGEKNVYILMNKPKDYATTMDDPNCERIVIDLLQGKVKERVYPVGRLDRNSMGVLLLTNDGELTKILTHPSYNRKKIYQVFIDKDLTDADLEQLTVGVELEDGLAFADEASCVEGQRKEIGIEIHSGRNRIVRRMFEKLGYKVRKLDRVYFAGLTKKGLQRGDWRYLTPREVADLRKGIEQ